MIDWLLDHCFVSLKNQNMEEMAVGFAKVRLAEEAEEAKRRAAEEKERDRLAAIAAAEAAAAAAAVAAAAAAAAASADGDEPRRSSRRRPGPASLVRFEFVCACRKLPHHCYE